MEFEQLVKRLEWLDEEHRKTRTSITALEEKMAALEGSIDAVSKQIKPLGKQIADVASTAAWLDQFDAIFAKQREDMNKALDTIEKRHEKREKELTKRHQQDLEPLTKAIETLKKTTDRHCAPRRWIFAGFGMQSLRPSPRPAMGARQRRVPPPAHPPTRHGGATVLRSRTLPTMRAGPLLM